VVVCMFQSDKGSRWICLWFAGLFYGYLSWPIFGYAMDRQRVQQQVLNSSSSSLKTISSPRTKLVRESCGALGAGQIRQLLLCSSSSSSSFLKMKTVISQ
jgi:hypothetical protein